ncbi:hypothetical protein ES703_83185 [subsurface metagenome]
MAGALFQIGSRFVKLTDKGYIYRVWHSPVGVFSEEYEPRKATMEEITTLIGGSGAYEELLPENLVKGRVVFEIPKLENPIEATINEVFPLIRFTG